jgi:hypothetical protein
VPAAGFVLFVEDLDWEEVVAVDFFLGGTFFFVAPMEGVPSITNTKRVASRERKSGLNFIACTSLRRDKD